MFSPKIYVFHAEMDSKTCDICEEYDGREFRLNELEDEFPNVEIGVRVSYPNVHPNCRCRLEVEEKKEEFDWED